MFSKIPKEVSLERRLMLLAYGARLLDYKDATGERPEAQRTHPWQEPEREATLDEIVAYCRRTGAYFNNQATNPANPEAHYRTTGPEIWQDTEGHVDILVCMAGTCARSFYVGDVKKEDIHAKFEDGVLHVELPAPQQTKALPENPNLIEIE